MGKRKNKFLNGLSPAKGWGFTESKTEVENKPILQTTTALFLSAGVGAFAGAAMGKPSFYSGIATTVAGALLKSPIVSHLGMGMTLSGGYQVITGFEGTGINGVKERVKAFGEDLKQRMYLDKIFKPKDEMGFEGLGSVQYFRYPLNGSQLDTTAIDKVISDIARSAGEFSQSQSVNGFSSADRIY